MKSTRTLAVLAIVGSAAVFSCTGGETGTDGHTVETVSIDVNAVFSTGADSETTSAVDRLRVTAQRVDSRAVLAVVVLDVLPEETEWSVALEVTPPFDDPRVLVLIEMISLTGGVESVEWAGLTAPLPLVPGRAVSVGPVTVFRGPADNLGVTSIAIDPPGEILEGAGVQLSVTVQTDRTGLRPTIQWASKDPSVATVTADGFLEAVAPGSARVSAISGRHENEIVVTVLQRATALRFATQPTDTDVGRPFDPPPSVEIVDVRGARVEYMTTPVTIDLEETTGATGAAPPTTRPEAADRAPEATSGLNGSTTVAAVAGLATFSDLYVDATGQFRLRATASGLVSASSNPFMVDVLPADLTVSKVVDRSIAHMGEEVEFLVTVTNLGPHTARGVALTDQLPAGLTLDTAEPSHGTYVASTGRWVIGDLEPGGSATLEMDTEVAAGVLGTTLVNTATADVLAFQNDDPSNNVSTASVGIGARQADIEIFKHADPTTAQVGDEITYTVTVVNHGPDEAIGIVVEEAPAEGLDIEVLSVDVGTLDTPGTLDGEDRVWRLESLEPGGEAHLTVKARVDPDVEPGEVLTNTVVARPLEDQGDDPSNNVAEASVEILARHAEIEILKEADVEFASAGGEVIYTITVINHGPDDAYDLVVTEDLPSEVVVDGTEVEVEVFDPDANEWTIDELAAGESKRLKLTTQVKTGVADGKVLENRVQRWVPKGIQDDSSNNEASAMLYVHAAYVDLSATKTVDRTSAAVGETVRYTITVSNHGPGVSTGAVLTELVPLQLEVPDGAFQISQGHIDVDGNVVWEIGTLDPGKSATLTLDATVKSSPAGLTVVNGVIVIPGQDEPDPDSTNNIGQAILTVPVPVGAPDVPEAHER